MTKQQRDIIIIGGGPAGLTAGLYASRSRLNVVLLERMGCGGQAAITDHIENYPGFPDGVSGYELTAKMEQQARVFGLEIASAEVQSLAVQAPGVIAVETADARYQAAAVIVASGARFKTIGVPGENEFLGKGVSYCATCDGPFFRQKDVVVVGGGDSAVQEALYLTRFARTVTIVHRRDRFRAAKILADRAAVHPQITIKWNTTVTGITGSTQVEGVSLADVATGAPAALPCQGVFVFVGWTPNTAFLPSNIARDDAGYILTDDHLKTSVDGIFACGDARRKLLRQVVTACGEGATAAFAAQEYLDMLRGTVYA